LEQRGTLYVRSGFFTKEGAAFFCICCIKGRLGVAEGTQIRRKDGKAWILRASSLICVVLLTLMTFVQVSHVHPATDSDSCPICVVMHSAVPVAVAAPPVVVAIPAAAILVPVIRTVSRQWDCTLFNRPPPVQG
jgi:hypothetical protein